MTALFAATLLLMQFLCQVFATEGSGCEPPRGYQTISKYNAAYKIHEEHVPWAEARDRCIAEGAHLAVITSFEKLRDTVNRTILESEIFMFIGIHRPIFTREWVRVDNGLPVTSMPWSALNDDTYYKCAVIWRGRTGSFTDYNCRTKLAFVCESPLAEGCPNSVGLQN